jgi:hypothetical protein
VDLEIPDFTETQRRVVETVLREQYKKSMPIEQRDLRRVFGFVPGARFAAQ